MHDNRAARRYAQALFEVATEHNLVITVENDLIAFSKLIEENAEFRSFYVAPYTSRQEKIEVVEQIFAGSISPLSLELIKLMVSKGRGREIPAVTTEFVQMRRDRSGIVYAHITSSIPLSDTQKRALSAKLETVIGKRVEADYKLDPRILGGIKVLYGNNSIDGSIRGALQNLRDQFHHDVLRQA